ncbi:MAG: alkaline phosphatase family protein [Planctomycetota bacterium]|nr:alkaline phosphatase family protein [Planctomycetota bacterium]
MNTIEIMQQKLIRCVCFLVVFIQANAMQINAWANETVHPRLVVVISVDQFCADYLVRFQTNFSKNADESFCRSVLESGAWFPNCHHQHALTYTAPGHAGLLTGAYPNTHGVIGNEWFDRSTGETRYCVSDPSVKVVGVASEKSMSPRVLLVDTVGDMMKLATNGKAKVFGVAIKDRASILMTGHRADAAYWLEKNRWVTSTYYREDLPGYLRVLNDGDAIDQFRGKTWDLLLPKEKYFNQGDDNNEFENPPKGFTASFPHQLASVGEALPDEFGEQVLFSPFGNDYTLLAAREIIRNEELGADDIPDLLAINFSSNDYIGHAFGPMSYEVEDMTYRTDRQLADFAGHLDEAVGAGRWTLVITADHGVAPIPEIIAQHMQSKAEIPSPKRNPIGNLNDVQDLIEAAIRKDMAAVGNAEEDAARIVLKVEPNQVHLNHAHTRLEGAKVLQAQRIARDWLLSQRYVAAAATQDELQSGNGGALFEQLRLSFHSSRSGDVLFVYTPYSIPGSSSPNAKPRGTTHGSPWQYDTNVPLLILGNGVVAGRYVERVSPAQIAPTLSKLLGISPPAGCAVEALYPAIKIPPRF